MKNSIYLILSLFIFSCTQENSPVVVDDIDIESYQISLGEKTSTQEAQLDFWNQKLEQSPNNSVYLNKLAAIHAAAFKTNKDITDLQISDQILNLLHEQFPQDVSVIHSMVSNAITRHSFEEASELIMDALRIGEKKYQSQLMLVDVHLEQGHFEDARAILETLNDGHRFDNQIRWVKLLDAEGDLDAAVTMMEAALEHARSMNNKDLIVWSLGNLGDMYGHQGRIERSYEFYRRALKLDPSESHAIKGIGWIAYSHDQDLDRAEGIWQSMREIHPDPELDLLLSEILMLQGDIDSGLALRDEFIATVSNEAYGNMYGSYLIPIYAESEPGKALAVAESDIAQRPHPVSYAHLALSKLENSDSRTAIELVREHVIGRTSEPEAIYISGIVFQEAGYSNLAQRYLSEAQDAAYELGPLAASDIQNRLTSL